MKRSKVSQAARNYKAVAGRHKTVILAAGVIVGIAGLVALQFSGAAGFLVSSEAESGTVTGNAVKDAMAGASGNNAVTFRAGATPPGTPPPTMVGRIFTEDFEAGHLNQWSNQSCPEGATVTTERARKGSRSVRLSVADGDTNARCSRVPTSNPRAQLVSDGLFKDGDDLYIGFSTFFPADFPTQRSWFLIAQIYGPPFGGSPSMGVSVDGAKVCFSRDESHNYDKIWCMGRDVARGTTWEDFVFHIKFSTSASVGFVEIWHNDVRQTLKGGVQRINYQTLRPGLNWNGTPNDLHLNQYRDSGQGHGTVTIYHDEAYVGRTYESVAR